MRTFDKKGQICKSDGFSPEIRLYWEVVLELMFNTAEFQKLCASSEVVLGKGFFCFFAFFWGGG